MTEQDLAHAITAVIRMEAAAQKMNPADLAKKARVPYPTLNRYLNDEREIKIAVVERLADALGKPVTWIVAAAERRKDPAATIAEYLASIGADPHSVTETSQIVTGTVYTDQGSTGGKVAKPGEAPRGRRRGSA